jgi:uncharacterized metal-binding protein YceD (DUF177 family)
MAETDHKLVLARLSRAADLPFVLTPGPEARTALARAFDLQALRKLRFAGRLCPQGKRDWLLEADFGATVVQPCVVTAEPVTTRIDEAVTRRFLAQMPEPAAEEAEIPEDDSIEPLPEVLDLWQVMAEALALAVPLYPRLPGAELAAARFAAPGVVPLDDEGIKPLAGLAALRDRLSGPDEPENQG